MVGGHCYSIAEAISYLCLGQFSPEPPPDDEEDLFVFIELLEQYFLLSPVPVDREGFWVSRFLFLFEGLSLRFSYLLWNGFCFF